MFRALPVTLLSLSLFLLTACQPAEAPDAQANETSANSADNTAAPAAETPEQQAARLQATFPAQQRAPEDPAQVALGEGIYGISCRGCHGQDLRGGDLGGPNLLRSEVVLADENGEKIGAVVKEGRSNPGMTAMPALNLADADLLAVASYIRSVLATARGQGAPPPGTEVPLNIVVGDNEAGSQHFDQLCSNCHSASGDLAGLASRIADAETLQNSWVAGRNVSAPPGVNNPRRMVSATVTLDNGQTVSGKLGRRDDFFISLTTENGEYRSFSLLKGSPAVKSVVIDDPLARHLQLLGELSDDMMHDITAYLVTLK